MKLKIRLSRKREIISFLQRGPYGGFDCEAVRPGADVEGGAVGRCLESVAMGRVVLDHEQGFRKITLIEMIAPGFVGRTDNAHFRRMAVDSFSGVDWKNAACGSEGGRGHTVFSMRIDLVNVITGCFPIFVQIDGQVEARGSRDENVAVGTRFG